MRTLLYLIAVTLLLAACQRQDFLFEKESSAPVTVTLNINQQQQSHNLRAANAMGPEIEDFIYDIWLLQYNSLGELVSADGVDKRQHLRLGEDGVTEVTGLEVTLLESENSTLFLIANLGDAPLENNVIWPDNLETFKQLSIPVDYLSVPAGDDNEGHVNRIGLMGVYRGAVQNSMTMNISFTRLITRLKLNIKPSYEMNSSVELKLENVRSRIYLFPTETPYQPAGSTDDEKAADRAANYTIFSKTLSQLDTTGIVQYFYVGENINPTAEDATRLTVSYNDDVYTTLLGTESPEVGDPSSRNLTLKRNSSYNFDINLKVGHYVEKDIDRTGWGASGGQGVNNPENIIDQNTSSYTNIWNTSTNPVITINTQKETKFTGFKLLQSTTYNYKASNITLSGSHDGTTFESILTTDISPLFSGEQSFDLMKTVEYKYVRLRVNSRFTSNSVYLYDFKLTYKGYEY